MSIPTSVPLTQSSFPRPLPPQAATTSSVATVNPLQPPQTTTPLPVTDHTSCTPRTPSNFEARGQDCAFPDRPSQFQAPVESNLNGVEAAGDKPTKSLKERIAEKISFGQKVEEPEDALLDRQEQLAEMSPAERKEALTAVAQEAGLSEPIVAQAQQFIDSLPEDKQVEATSYMENLFSQRGPTLGDEKMGRILTTLAQMPERTYDPRIGDSTDLAVSALHDIAAPTDIDQGDNTGTCSATAMQMALAHKDPERYLQMVDTLAQDQPFEKLTPDWSFQEEGKRGAGGEVLSFESYRSPSAKLVQNTIMEYANGSEDYSSEASIEKRPAGNDEAWLAGTLPAVMGDDQSYTMHHIDNGEYPDSDTNKNMPAAEVIKTIQDYQPSLERPLVLSYHDPEHGIGHAGLIVGADGDKITYIDPINGIKKEVSVPELEKVIWSVQVPDNQEP